MTLSKKKKPEDNCTISRPANSKDHLIFNPFVQKKEC
jgi:hypothetical protein